MTVLWLFYIAAYMLALGWLYWQWRQIPLPADTLKPERLPMLAVVIVARNEADNLSALLNDLAQQQYPASAYEVWLMDDSSEDNSKAVVEALGPGLPFSLHYQQIKKSTGLMGKKAGISQAVAQINTEYIIVTDADCRLPETWLKAWATALRGKVPKFAFGGVMLSPAKGFFQELQQTEFASLIGSGAALLGAGKPGMCNAANMAFNREAFLQVGGYAAIPDYPGGDDEFLLQKIWGRYPGQAAFIKDAALVVKTKPQPDFSSFQHQRRRWAGKWRLHKSITIRGTAIGLFLAQLLYLLLMAGLLLNQAFPLFFAGLFGKCLLEFVFLRAVLKLGSINISMRSLLAWQFLYPFYALWFGIQANRGSFRWKGRQFSLRSV